MPVQALSGTGPDAVGATINSLIRVVNDLETRVTALEPKPEEAAPEPVAAPQVTPQVTPEVAAPVVEPTPVPAPEPVVAPVAAPVAEAPAA